MASKKYQVLKSLKIDDEEHGVDAVVELTPKQAARLLGVFVDEYTPPVADDKGKGKGKDSKADGLS